ncbi:MAG: NAD(P)/FAD-dependent oxidoreductase [bacterium]|nr:NAD(P)/FAD-dependent oxidoreductase [bacterium]
MKLEQTVIVGAGPAGLSAARQLKLYGVDPLVYEHDKPGGLLLNAFSVVNFPGAPEGISGRELISNFPLPARLVSNSVNRLLRQNNVYQVHSNGVVQNARSVIIASGTVPVGLELPGIPESRICYSVKDLSGITGGTAAVIGSGDAALDYAMTLSSVCSVRVYARGDFSKAVPHLLQSVRKTKNITLCPESLPQSSFPEDVIVVAIGRKPKVDFISKKLLSSPPADDSFQMCGDCKNGIYRQATIAVGNGIEAAMKIAAFLKKTETL